MSRKRTRLPEVDVLTAWRLSAHAFEALSPLIATLDTACPDVLQGALEALYVIQLAAEARIEEATGSRLPAPTPWPDGLPPGLTALFEETRARMQRLRVVDDSDC